ncbi:hypothetical protein LTR09_007435 [Extremus antarcticus]|uniref:Cysteine-rich transmembrane domain-containing protein n=1 Tax=Extremus antarcticus TaxID=702011 RepID=A0AAJ0DCS2_9PEZI|nr:hypothetical protein LTR09_007435 [Extremus antarcticus]
MAYKAPDGPPPVYPQQAHYDAGPVDPRGQSQGYYGSPPPQQYGQPAPYQQGPYQQGPYGQPAPGYGPQYQQQPMYYQQQPPMGYHDDRRGGGMGAGGGICAGIMGALACCCCLDVLF